jgi:hypothetical protein
MRKSTLGIAPQALRLRIRRDHARAETATPAPPFCTPDDARTLMNVP